MDRALTVREVADEYGVKPATVYGWIKERLLRPIRLPGGDYRIRREHLAEFDGVRNAPAVPPLSFRENLRRIGGYKAPEGLGYTIHVYFIQVGEAGPIKIGIAANVRLRHYNLQTAHHEELRVLASLRGDANLETYLHAKFSGHRIRGEWFAPAPEILDLIAQLSAGAEDD